jgi:hypothetical protein
MMRDMETKTLEDLLSLNINSDFFNAVKKHRPDNPIDFFIDCYIKIHHTFLLNNDKPMDESIPLFLDLHKNTWVSYNIYNKESVSITEASFFKLSKPCNISKEVFWEIIFNSDEPKKALLPFFVSSS